MAGERPPSGERVVNLGQAARRRPSITSEQRHQTSSLSLEHNNQQQQEQYLAMRRASASNFEQKQGAGNEPTSNNSLANIHQQERSIRLADVNKTSNYSAMTTLVSNRLASLAFEPSATLQDEPTNGRGQQPSVVSRQSSVASGERNENMGSNRNSPTKSTTTTTTTVSNSNNNTKQFARDEIDVVFNRLMALEAFRKSHPSLIRNLCSYAFIERIEKGVLVFRQGDDAINWYALLEGSVDVRVSQVQSGQCNGQLSEPRLEDGVTLCTLGVGTTFGASVMPGKLHSVSVVTNEECTLLRVRRADFQQIFNEQSHLIHDLGASPFYPFGSMGKSLASNLNNCPPTATSGGVGQSTARIARQNSLTSAAPTAGRAHRNAAGVGSQRHQAPSGRLLEGAERRTSSAAGDFPRRQSSLSSAELALSKQQQQQQQSASRQTQQQQQAQMQQQQPNQSAADELDRQQQFGAGGLPVASPDACFQLILAKQPHERSAEEIDIVYEELQHLKALSHLTNSVKKQLAARIHSEQHTRQNTVIFNQGEVGHSWYIILRGSVNVVIVGKGVVCTLHDGDDFGKLALVNDAPRAATIVTNEPNCYFLRVDKQDFNTILRDVEANTVRLKEHGKEVLILQKVAIKEQPESGAGDTGGQFNATTSVMNNHSQVGAQLGPSGQTARPQEGATTAAAVASGASPMARQSQSSQTMDKVGANQLAGGQSSVALASSCALKYMVTAGTGEKMLEHLLETRIDGHTQTAPLALTKEALFQHDRVANYIQFHGDNFLEDFILTHKIFMPTGNLCQELLRQYQSSQPTRNTTATAAAATQTASANQSAGVKGRQINSLVDDEFLVAKKRRVVKFVRFWMLINREHFFQQQQIYAFVMALHQKVKMDAQRFSSLRAELEAITRIYELQLEESLESRHRGCQRWIEDVYGNILPIRRHLGPWQAPTLPAAAAPAPGNSATNNNNTNNNNTGGEQLTNSQQQLQMAASEQFLVSLHQRRFHHKLSTIQAEDELVFRVYCADHTFTTLKCRFDEQAGQIKQVAARNLKLDEKELILVHVKSNGERIIYNDQETNICTCLSVNGRLFVCPLEHIDAVCPLPEQDPFQEVYSSLTIGSSSTTTTTTATARTANENLATSGSIASQQQQQQTAANSTPLANSASANQQQQQQDVINSHLLSRTPVNHADIKLQMSLSVNRFEQFSSRDVAFCLTQLAWSLLNNMHEFELVYTVFGRQNFKQITANLNVFLRHFNELQFWVVTQICLASSLSKRVQILRKFIKIAAHCKELQNLNAFFAITMGLSNMAVARLAQTWERIPNKLKRLFGQFEALIDPSRNHRRYRIFLATLEPPIVPFMPLFLKDMTFAHEGNKTYLENGLINFEKMQMVAQALRTIRQCKSRSMKLDPSICKFKSSIRTIDLFFRDLKIIDNQRTLTQMSHQLEHRKT